VFLARTGARITRCTQTNARRFPSPAAILGGVEVGIPCGTQTVKDVFYDVPADWQVVWQCASPFSLSSIAGLSGIKREIV